MCDTHTHKHTHTHTNTHTDIHTQTHTQTRTRTLHTHTHTRTHTRTHAHTHIYTHAQVGPSRNQRRSRMSGKGVMCQTANSKSDPLLLRVARGEGRYSTFGDLHLLWVQAFFFFFLCNQEWSTITLNKVTFVKIPCKMQRQNGPLCG